jgi:hypothetical protein
MRASLAEQILTCQDYTTSITGIIMSAFGL